MVKSSVIVSESKKEIIISDQPLDLQALNQKIQVSQGENGASVIFTGNVRVAEAQDGLTGMTLEHFPGLTESLLNNILTKATLRWKLSSAIVAHRIGYLKAGQPIVFIGTCSLHRRAAFEAAQFIMDYLKNQATFWKKEHFLNNGHASECWVEAKQADQESLGRWE